MNSVLDVYLDHDLVGYLTKEHTGSMSFVYASKWLEHTNSIALSYSLPLREESFTQRECRGFFAGILPEESKREMIARIFGISARNDYAMLEQIGGECAGAVTFLPSGKKLSESKYSYEPLNDDKLAEVFGKLPNQPLLAGTPGLRLSLAGAQNKIAVYVDDNGKLFLPLGGAPSTHIIKPAIERFPNIVSNETFCLDLARFIGIPAVTVKTKNVNNIEYLLVERYDRKRRDEN